MAMSTALVIDAVVANDDIAVTDSQFAAKRRKAAKRWGAGTVLKIRIEPEDEAWKHSDVKHLYGHLYAPVAARTGETVAEVHLRMKVQFFPEDGRTSLTQLNRVEMKSFVESVEQDIREHDPESWDDCVAAMALFDSTRRAS